MKTLFTCVGMAALLICSPAMAQTISGKYIMTIHVVCQPTVTFNFGNASGVGNYVNGVTLGPSDVVNNMFLATFNPAKQSVSFTGFEDRGDVLLVQETGAVTGNSGFPFQENPLSGKSSYSNTSTTATINGQTSNALFGQVDKNGITHYFTFQSVNTNGAGVPCANQGEASRQ